jgi:hypothetical protein
MAKPLTASQKAALAKEKARQAAAAAKKNKPKPAPKPAAKPATPKPPAKPAARPALPPGRPGGPLAIRPKPALPPGRPGGPLAVRPKRGLGSGIGMAAAIVNQAMDVGRGFQKLANHPFINNRGKGSKPTPSAGRRTNPNAAKPKPKLADIRGTSTSKFADLRGSSKPGSSAPAVARELPKPTPKPTVTKAAAPSPRKVAPTPAKPKAPAKAKPPAASATSAERRVSASTSNRESGNYGTSKTNNPLMKDMVARMKAREDKAQAAAASKLTYKPNKDSGYTPKDKVKGSEDYSSKFKNMPKVGNMKFSYGPAGMKAAAAAAKKMGKPVQKKKPKK